MPTNALNSIKSILTRVGSLTPISAIHALDSVTNYLEVGRWMKANGYRPLRRAHRREELFTLVAKEVADKNVLYLEFGVYNGESMTFWSRLLKNPESHLDGFDSFEGLPESWSRWGGMGLFSTGGRVPNVPDPRVSFVKGWFSETLPSYRPPDHEVMVINVDCDLYSSTVTVLEHCKQFMHPGDYLFFDEFCDRNHELKAFREFLGSSGMRFRLVGADRTLTHVVFQRLE